MGQNLKLKSFDFNTNASEIINCYEYGTRRLLNSNLEWIDEEEYKEKVEMSIKERKEVKIKGLNGLKFLEDLGNTLAANTAANNSPNVQRPSL